MDWGQDRPPQDSVSKKNERMMKKIPVKPVDIMTFCSRRRPIHEERASIG